MPKDNAIKTLIRTVRNDGWVALLKKVTYLDMWNVRFLLTWMETLWIQEEYYKYKRWPRYRVCQLLNILEKSVEDWIINLTKLTPSCSSTCHVLIQTLHLSIFDSKICKIVQLFIYTTLRGIVGLGQKNDWNRKTSNSSIYLSTYKEVGCDLPLVTTSRVGNWSGPSVDPVHF